MEKTKTILGYLTPILITTLASPLSGQIKLEGIELSVYTKNLNVQTSSAEKATLTSDGKRVHAEGLSLKMNLEDNREASAKAETGIIVVKGNDATTVEQTPASTDTDDEELEFTLSEITRLSDQFNELAASGDLYMESTSDGPIAEVNNSMTLYSTRLIWSDKMERYILPDELRQDGKTEDGSRLEVKAAAAVSKKNFRDWVYYGTQDTSIVMTYEIPTN